MNAQVVNRKNRRQIRRKKLMQQKLWGLAMIAVSAFIVWIALCGKTAEERDITAVLLTAPMGLYLLFTKDIIIN